MSSILASYDARTIFEVVSSFKGSRLKHLNVLPRFRNKYRTNRYDVYFTIRLCYFYPAMKSGSETIVPPASISPEDANTPS